MYCKNCGKQVENDANFCKHCGACLNFNYDNERPEPTGENRYGLLDKYENLSPERKKWFWAYVIWFTIHLILLASGESDCNGYGFFPWYEEWGKWKLEWELKVYGLPEFLVYTVLIPVTIFLISRIIDKAQPNADLYSTSYETIHQDNQENETTDKQGITTTEKTWAIICLVLFGMALIGLASGVFK